jgi:hypothetical protein
MIKAKFNTSQRVNIMDQEGNLLVKGAIVRSYNTQTQEYYLTFRGEDELDKSFNVKEDQIQPSGTERK